MHTVTFLAANGNVVHDVCAQGAQCLHQQSSGGLPVYVEVAPDADSVMALDRGENDFYRVLDIGKGHRGQPIGMEKGVGSSRSQNPAANESLRDEWVQVKGRERGGNLNRLRIEPASHPSDYTGWKLSTPVIS